MFPTRTLLLNVSITLPFPSSARLYPLPVKKKLFLDTFSPKVFFGMLIIFILAKDSVGKYRISAEEDNVLLFSNVPEAAVDCK
jgi:hypothetical protein